MLVICVVECVETFLSARSCSRMLFYCASAVCINSWNGAAQSGHTMVVGCMQAFYAEFGELMMRQPVIGLDFQSYLPTAIVPYMLLLVFNVFNRYDFTF